VGDAERMFDDLEDYSEPGYDLAPT